MSTTPYPHCSRFTVASAQYPVERHEDWSSYERKLDRWVSEAAHHGARLLVFPEYGPMELASLFGEEVCRSLPVQLDAMQGLLSRFLHLHQLLAARYAVHIVAGSFPVAQDGGGYRNRSHLVRPDGQIDWQEKLQMTRFENEQWHIDAGDEIKVFDTELGTLGIAICYDVEFPLIARQQAEAGASVVLVPSCTDSVAGWNRVRLGARARAMENQFYVVQSPTVGDAPWTEAIDVNVGAAGIYGPVDRGFPADGVLAQGTLNEPQWVFAELDMVALEEVRANGQVFNFREWDGQFRPTAPRGKDGARDA